MVERHQEKYATLAEQPRFRCCALFGFAFLLPALIGYAKLLGEPIRGQALVPRPSVRKIEVTLAAGETLQAVLGRFRLDKPAAHAIIEAVRPFINPRKLRPGQGLQMILDPRENAVSALELPLGGAVVRVRSTPEGWLAERGEIPFVKATRVVRGALSRNLFQDGTAAGLTPGQILDLTDIFQFDIDFFSDFRRGDTFSVAFEEIRYVNGRRETRQILAAELMVAGDPVRAFHHSTPEGDGSYYDADGRALRRAFLRAPLNYRRISSFYSLSRSHPILRMVQPHRAIDYAASAGTPVVAIGRGTVSFAGWRDGYGNMVEVTHANGYSSRYAHFSRIAAGVRKGKRVTQAEVIGFVGQTGHATGPHLHFELLRGQDKINFLALRIPPEQRLSGEEMDRFNAVRDERRSVLRGEELQLANAGS